MSTVVRLGKWGVALALTLGFSMLFSSCNTEEIYRTEVTVINTQGFPVQNCQVRLYAPCVGCQVDVSSITDLAGVASFEFPAKMVLNIQANKGPLSGEGFVQLIENKTVQETVIVN